MSKELNNEEIIALLDETNDTLEKGVKTVKAVDVPEKKVDEIKETEKDENTGYDLKMKKAMKHLKKNQYESEEDMEKALCAKGYSPAVAKQAVKSHISKKIQKSLETETFENETVDGTEFLMELAKDVKKLTKSLRNIETEVLQLRDENILLKKGLSVTLKGINDISGQVIRKGVLTAGGIQKSFDVINPQTENTGVTKDEVEKALKNIRDNSTDSIQKSLAADVISSGVARGWDNSTFEKESFVKIKPEVEKLIGKKF